MAACRLSRTERDDLAHLLSVQADITITELARHLDRHRSTISRELARNGGRDNYRPTAATERAHSCARRPKPHRLTADTDLGAHVAARLAQGYSPYAIAALLARNPDGPQVCAETIYQAIYQRRLGCKPADVLRTRRHCRRPRHGRRPRTDNVLGVNIARICDRPENTSLEAGHWEGDMIIGKRNATAAVTLVEQHSGLINVLALPDGYTAVNVANTLSDWIAATPTAGCRSITWDRGREMANWEALVDAWGIDIWFCDPHSPWQRPKNECANRQLRFWFPKSTSLALPQTDFDRACAVLNNQPRRQHQGRTAAEVYYAALTVH